MLSSNVQETTVDSYNLVLDGANITAPTAFPIGVASGDMDLLAAKHGGRGEGTRANYVEIIISGDGAGTGTVLVTGAVDQGPEEAIATLTITTTTIAESGGYVWADTMTMSSHHLSGCSIAVADSGNSRVAKFGFDAIGLRYLRFYPQTDITDIRIYARHF